MNPAFSLTLSNHPTRRRRNHLHYTSHSRTLNTFQYCLLRWISGLREPFIRPAQLCTYTDSQHVFLWLLFRRPTCDSLAVSTALPQLHQQNQPIKFLLWLSDQLYLQEGFTGFTDRKRNIVLLPLALQKWWTPWSRSHGTQSKPY